MGLRNASARLPLPLMQLPHWVYFPNAIDVLFPHDCIGWLCIGQ